MPSEFFSQGKIRRTNRLDGGQRRADGRQLQLVLALGQLRQPHLRRAALLGVQRDFRPGQHGVLPCRLNGEANRGNAAGPRLVGALAQVRLDGQLVQRRVVGEQAVPSQHVGGLQDRAKRHDADVGQLPLAGREPEVDSADGGGVVDVGGRQPCVAAVVQFRFQFLAEDADAEPMPLRIHGDRRGGRGIGRPDIRLDLELSAGIEQVDVVAAPDVGGRSADDDPQELGPVGRRLRQPEAEREAIVFPLRAVLADVRAGANLQKMAARGILAQRRLGGVELLGSAVADHRPLGRDAVPEMVLQQRPRFRRRACRRRGNQPDNDQAPSTPPNRELHKLTFPICSEPGTDPRLV